MTSEQFVRFNCVQAKEHVERGNFVGGRVRYSIKVGAKTIGCDVRRKSAWAEAARWIRAQEKHK